MIEHLHTHTHTVEFSLVAEEIGINPMLIHANDSKMVLDTSLLNTQHYKVRITDKEKQSRERSSALP